MKNSNRFLPLFTALFTLAAFVASAQELKIQRAPTLHFPATMSQKAQEQCIATANQTLAAYQEAASLFEKEKREVTNDAIKKFHALFAGNAKIVKDFYEFPPTFTTTDWDYAQEVFLFLKSSGVKFFLKEPTLTEVRIDQRGYYDLTVKVKKSVFNYLDKDKIERKSTTGLLRELTFVISVSQDNLGVAKIASIERAGGCPTVEYTTYIGGAVNAGVGLMQRSTGQHWAKNHPEATLDAKMKPVFGLQAFYQTNKFLSKPGACERPLSVFVGLGIQRYAWDLSLSGYEIPAFDDPRFPDPVGTDVADRVGINISGTQKEGFTAAQIQLGLSYQVAKKDQLGIFLTAGVMPAFQIGSKSRFDLGTSFWDLQYSGIPYSLLGKQAINGVIASQIKADYQYGKYEAGEVSHQTKLKTNFFNLNVVAGVNGFFDFKNENPTWGVLFGANLCLPITAQIASEPFANDVLKYPEDDPQNPPTDFGGISNSLLNSYFEKVKMPSLCLRVGLYRRLNAQP